MVKITYEVVEHDGGWAYRAGNAYSETFPSHDAALTAARNAAAEQQVGGMTDGITYQDAAGVWHEEVSDGGDRPETEVTDDNR